MNGAENDRFGATIIFITSLIGFFDSGEYSES